MDIQTRKPFKPGHLVFLDYPTGTHDNNYFVYLGRRGNVFELVKAGIDPERDEIVRTGERADLHIDFEDHLKPVLGIMVR